MKTKVLFFFLSTLFLFTACDNSPEILPELKSTNQLISFKFEKDKNVDYLESDIEGIIQNEEIKLTISEEINATKLIATFTHNGEEVTINNTIQISGITANDFSKPTVYVVEAENGSKKSYTVNITWIGEEIAQIPHLYIDTENKQPIDLKKVYRTGTLRIDGGDKYEDFEGGMSIRGRGNSTWEMPKKPYRIKLDSKASLLGLSAEKDWVLLQNYIDPSLMSNAVAMKTGQLLEMPFTHHIIPVDVTLNGEYIGSYTFTEHKEVEDNRINVGDGGWLIELDEYFDEVWKFKSNRFQLPVMIQYPELDKMTDATEAQLIFDEIKSDFNSMEELIFDESFPNNNYLEYFDADAFINYLIVYTLTGNEEINHPKSTYIYKKQGEKYSMGPIWDFDWAFGFEGTYTHFVDPGRKLFWTGGNIRIGTRFFSKLMQDPVLQDLYRTEWSKFKTQKYPILVEYIKEYAETIRESHAKDQVRWEQSTGSIDKYRDRLLDWLNERVDYMDNFYVGS